MELKHTPGPWKVREVSHSNVPGKTAYAIDFNDDQEQVVDWVYEKADAQLIAAAPDLLEAAVQARGVLNTVLGETTDENAREVLIRRIETLSSAIARATGAQ